MAPVRPLPTNRPIDRHHACVVEVPVATRIQERRLGNPEVALRGIPPGPQRFRRFPPYRPTDLPAWDTLDGGGPSTDARLRLYHQQHRLVRTTFWVTFEHFLWLLGYDPVRALGPFLSSLRTLGRFLFLQLPLSPLGPRRHGGWLSFSCPPKPPTNHQPPTTNHFPFLAETRKQAPR